MNRRYNVYLNPIYDNVINFIFICENNQKKMAQWLNHASHNRDTFSNNPPFTSS